MFTYAEANQQKSQDNFQEKWSGVRVSLFSDI
jgi:hypothetical protein